MTPRVPPLAPPVPPSVPQPDPSPVSSSVPSSVSPPVLSPVPSPRPEVPDTASLAWEDGVLLVVDQRELPHRRSVLRITTTDQVVDAITTLAVRGAPAIGLAGAFGVVLSARRHARTDGSTDVERVRRDAERIAAARPTAVNLRWAVDRALEAVPDGPGPVLDRVRRMVTEDVEANDRAARRAAAVVRGLCPDRPLRILTHCHTGRLATGGAGTALGAVEALARDGHVEEVLVDETRPLLQGARLTAWELERASIPHRLLTDSAAASAMAAGLVDCVLVGADRITADGDVANKIGTYGLAVSAARHGIPFVVVAPESTRDRSTRSGREIVVEQRSASEVTTFAGRAIAPAGTPAYNPAFDVTPADLITAVVTETGTSPEPSGPGTRLLARVVTSPGSPVPDLSGVYDDPVLHRDCVAALARPAARAGVDRVLATAGGLVLGAGIAGRLGVPLTPARAGLAAGAVRPGETVLVVDDALVTGGTAAAAVDLAVRHGARVAGVAALLVLARPGGPRPGDVPVHRIAEVSG